MSETIGAPAADVLVPEAGAPLTPDAARAGVPLDGPVGFVGLGAMGLPMATRLVMAGVAVLACDTDAGRLSAFVDATSAADAAAGAHTTPMVAEIAARCGRIILMLPTSADVAAAVDAMEDALADGTLLIDMGSSVPSATRALAARLTARGVTLIDAPVSGAVAGAVAGTLTVMAGGADEAVGRARDLFAAIGQRVIRTGATGSAHAMKALNNYVYAAGLLATVEATRLAEASGLDTEILAEVLNTSSGRNWATETKLRQFVLSGTYSGGFRLALMAKDLATAGTIAAETGVDATSLAACRAAYGAALEMLGIEADTTAIHRAIGPTLL